MPKAVITLSDLDGQIDMKLELEGGFQGTSPAHRCAEKIIDYMDGLMSAAPEMVVTAEESRARKAKSLRHLATEPAVIHGG